MIKRAAVICFTENGRKTAEKIKECLDAQGAAVTLAKKYSGASDSIAEPLKTWTGREFMAREALIYVGAAGIAVRAVAPFIRSKAEDPAVLVVDEQGHFCIPILSGHMGGANELAKLIGGKLGAVPVITTATDLSGKWAVDVFARKNRLKIQDMRKAKEVSARLLSGKNISVYLEESCRMVPGGLPEGVKLWPGEEGDTPDTVNRIRKAAPDIVIGIRKYTQWSGALYLIPKVLVLGIGCRKGTGARQLEEKVLAVLEENDIFLESVGKAASVDLKKEESGILKLCEKYGWPFETFSPEMLKRTEGEFSSSGFVRAVTGVDNICERSAVCASGGAILVPKQAGDGITVAAAVGKWEVRF